MEKRKPKKTSQDHEIIIPSGARLTVETISDFIRLVRDALNKAKRVALQFDSDIEVDITALQAICSTCKTAAAEGKAFSYYGPYPQAMTDLVVASGAGRLDACKQNHDGLCLWFDGVR